jgi:CO/xanthine dehydrogenase FAD-binding subunit
MKDLEQLVCFTLMGRSSVKPPAFAYHVPTNLDEALALLQSSPDAKLLAGGQTLVPAMSMRVARPTTLIDLNFLPGLDRVLNCPQHIVIGAMTRHRQLLHAPELNRVAPLLRLAVPHIAHFQIRNRGTIGGSLAHNDPAAELPAIVAAFDGSMVLKSSIGTREIRWDKFFTGMLSTALQPDEILTEIRLPVPAPNSGAGFAEIARRHGDFALVGALALLTGNHSNSIIDARLVLFGIGDGPYRAHEAERNLIGAEATEDTFRAVAELAVCSIEPPSDLHASSEYRKKTAAVLARRVLKQAWESRPHGTA